MLRRELFDVWRCVLPSCVLHSWSTSSAAIPDVDATVPRGTYSDRCDAEREWTLGCLSDVCASTSTLINVRGARPIGH